MKIQYIVTDDGKILHSYKGEPISFGGPWQYKQTIESAIENGKAQVKNGKITIVKGD